MVRPCHSRGTFALHRHGTHKNCKQRSRSHQSSRVANKKDQARSDIQTFLFTNPGSHPGCRNTLKDALPSPMAIFLDKHAAFVSMFGSMHCKIWEIFLERDIYPLVPAFNTSISKYPISTFLANGLFARTACITTMCPNH
jgi:hypothetical protein